MPLFVVHFLVEVHHWKQPPTVNYQSGPYAMTVYETSPILSPYHQYEVWVGWDPSYGHATEYGFHTRNANADYFEQCRTEWSPEGVTLIEPTGHKLFIPKDAFIGGR